MSWKDLTAATRAEFDSVLEALTAAGWKVQTDIASYEPETFSKDVALPCRAMFTLTAARALDHLTASWVAWGSTYHLPGHGGFGGASIYNAATGNSRYVTVDALIRQIDLTRTPDPTGGKPVVWVVVTPGPGVFDDHSVEVLDGPPQFDLRPGTEVWTGRVNGATERWYPDDGS